VGGGPVFCRFISGLSQHGRTAGALFPVDVPGRIHRRAIVGTHAASELTPEINSENLLVLLVADGVRFRRRVFSSRCWIK